ncbi:MAG: hypothetical protein ACK4IT_03965 [Thioalkalivibrionaceae bacterium]
MIDRRKWFVGSRAAAGRVVAIDPSSRRQWLKGAWRVAASLSFGAGLTACGFRPRDSLSVPAINGESAQAEGESKVMVWLRGVSRDETFTQALSRALAAVGVGVVFARTDATAADVMLELQTRPVAFERRELRVAAGSRISEIEWSGRAEARLMPWNESDVTSAEARMPGRDPIELGPVRARRRYSFASDLILAQDERDLRLQRAIEQDLANALVRRLTLELGDARKRV